MLITNMKVNAYNKEMHFVLVWFWQWVSKVKKKILLISSYKYQMAKGEYKLHTFTHLMS